MEYVKVNPALIEKPATDDFEDEDVNYWSHAIKDKDGDSVFFGDFVIVSDADFDFEYFRLQIEKTYRVFTWAQAREFAQAIIKLADKHEMLPTSGVGTDRPCNRPFMGED